MDLIDAREQAGKQPMNAIPTPGIVPSTSRRSGTTILPQVDSGTCSTCGSPLESNPKGSITYPYVYAIGHVEARFPTVGIEKEYRQVTGRADTRGLTEQGALYQALKENSNRYLARRMCYVLTIQEVDTYILQPRDPMEFNLLIEAIRPGYDPEALDTVIGVRGPIAPPEMCNGLMIPIVVFDQIYSFDRASHRNAIPRHANVPEELFTQTADEVLTRIMQMTDNAGATDEDRALNYLALRYDRIYTETANAHDRSESLSGIEVRTAPLGGARKLVDVIFSYTHRSTDVVDKWSVRVDVTEEFPFLVTPMSRHMER